MGVHPIVCQSVDSGENSKELKSLVAWWLGREMQIWQLKKPWTIIDFFKKRILICLWGKKGVILQLCTIVGIPDWHCVDHWRNRETR